MQEKCKKKTNNIKHYKTMRLSFCNKLINSIEKIETVTLDEKHDKADTIIAITAIIRARGFRVNWIKGKWKVTEQEEIKTKK